MKAVQCNWIPVDKLAEYLLMTTTKKLFFLRKMEHFVTQQIK